MSPEIVESYLHLVQYWKQIKKIRAYNLYLESHTTKKNPCHGGHIGGFYCYKIGKRQRKTLLQCLPMVEDILTQVVMDKNYNRKNSVDGCFSGCFFICVLFYKLCARVCFITQHIGAIQCKVSMPIHSKIKGTINIKIAMLYWWSRIDYTHWCFYHNKQINVISHIVLTLKNLLCRFC